jgi:MFS family permease
MFGLAFTTNAYLAAALLAAYIFHVTVWNICAVSLRQRLVPEEMRGRQNSFFKLSGLIGLVLGAAIAGPLANATDLATPFGLAGFIFAVCVAYTAWLLRVETDTSPAPGEDRIAHAVADPRLGAEPERQSNRPASFSAE